MNLVLRTDSLIDGILSSKGIGWDSTFSLSQLRSIPVSRWQGWICFMYRLRTQWLWCMLGGVLVLGLSDRLYARLDAPFNEMSNSLGVNYFCPMTPPNHIPEGRGLAWVDLDNDLDPDLVLLGSVNGVVGVYENVAGTFIDRSDSTAIPPLPTASGVVAFDYDGDDDLDLLVTQWNLPNILLRNDGGFLFMNVSYEMGLTYVGPATGPTVADYDGDGWVDLFLTLYGEPNRLFRNNNGDGFIDVTATSGIFGSYNSLQASFFDFDLDGDKDIYVSNDQRTPTNTYEYNRLYENTGGQFVEISELSGTDIRLLSMNVGIGDLDRNGYPDIYCTNGTVEVLNQYLPNMLLMNNGDQTFYRAEAVAGVDSYRFGWGAQFFDFDNNGFLDLYVCNQIGDNRLYVNSGTWPLVDMASTYRVDVTPDSRCVAVADIDSDGDLDMAVQVYNDTTRIFINQEGNAGPNRYLRVVPIGRTPNRHSIGAQVELRTGNDWQSTEIVAGSTYKTQSELVAHFGLGTATVADEILVTWPDGATRRLLAIAGNQQLTVLHPSYLGDANDDGMVNVGDIAAFYQRMLGGESGPTIAAIDFSGDGTLDGRDVAGFVDRMLQ